MRRFLVTGGAGFIGSHLTEALVRRGDHVRVLDDLSSGRLENLAALRLGETGSGAPVELVRGSIASSTACRAACEGVEAVFHEAALVSVPRSLEDPDAVPAPDEGFDEMGADEPRSARDEIPPHRGSL